MTPTGRGTRGYRGLLVALANTPAVLTATLVGTWAVAGALFTVLEGVPLEDGLYWSAVTMTTTGYGDVSPAGTAGRVLAGVLMIWSIFFLIPAAIWHVADRLLQDRDEWTHEEQVQLREDLQRILVGMERLSAPAAQDEGTLERLERVERLLAAGEASEAPGGRPHAASAHGRERRGVDGAA